MNPGKWLRQAHSSVIEIGISSAEFNETGTAIVLSIRPFRLLVPSHLVVAIEDGSIAGLTIDDVTFRDITPLCSPVLEQHELAVLQINQPAPAHLRPIRIGKDHVEAFPGQIGVLVSHRSVSSNLQSGPFLSSHSDGRACMVTLDVCVRPGDSGSPVLARGQLVGVVQGMRTREEKTVAVVVVLSKQARDEIKALAGLRSTAVRKTALALLTLALAFGALSAPPAMRSPLPSTTRSEPPAPAMPRNFHVGTMPHAIEFVDDRYFVAQMNTGLLVELDLETGQFKGVASDLVHPCDLALIDESRLLYTNEQGLLGEISLADGSLRILGSLQDYGLLQSDIVTGVEFEDGKPIALFYRDDKPHLLVHEPDPVVLPIYAYRGSELICLKRHDDGYLAIAFQDLMLFKLERTDHGFSAKVALSITQHAGLLDLAPDGLRAFDLSDTHLFLTSISYEPSYTQSTLHILDIGQHSL